MKILSFLLCLLLPVGALAQQKPRSGYETLIAAADMVKPGGGGPETASLKLDPEENLRRERVAVARNAAALKLARQALKLPIAVPPPTAANRHTYTGVSFSNLASQLRQESDVRLADGDVAGALESRLTGLELCVAVLNGGSYTDADHRAENEAWMREDFEPIAAKLSAPQIRATLARLKAIDARRPNYTQILKNTKQRVLVNNIHFLTHAVPQLMRMRSRLGKSYSGIVTDEMAKEYSTLTPAILTRQISAVFDAVIARDRLPFPNARKIKVPPTPFKFARNTTDYLRDPRSRFFYELNSTQTRLLAAALELRALKLERGAYPATFAPFLDPFTDSRSFIYKLDGDKYLLYSVGPNGKDDGGQPIELSKIDWEHGGVMSIAEPAPDSAGDILAPIF